ncbi:hypothetical protein Ddc_04706 [Ditylenchus destructor]|nr:hypothetical protein Ddc_04706 [Ditylenchus destructor]
MDNGTMVEAFKYLDYCGLAKKSLVSKRFRNVIQTHRHSLSRLCVEHIRMNRYLPTELEFHRKPDGIEIFGKTLSAEEYDEWVIRNHYSKQVPSEGQVVQKESTQNDCYVYKLYATEDKGFDRLFAHTELNDEHWPLFQHFIRLLSDPFICIDGIELSYQNDVMNLLVETITPDRGRLQCYTLYFNHHGNLPKFINWIKDHVCCYYLDIFGNTDSIHDQELLNFFLTAGQCASSMYTWFHDLSQVVVDFVKKFLELKNGDEYQLVQSFENVEDVDFGEEIQIVKVLMREYRDNLVKEERYEDTDTTTYYFEFYNDEIKKKLQLTVEYWIDFGWKPTISTEISLQ